MKCFVWILLASAGVAFAQNARPVFEIGRKLSPNMLQYIPKQLCHTAPSKVEPCVTVRLAGVIYRVGYSAKGKFITYLETHDPAFVSDRGLRVGDIVDEDLRDVAWLESFGEAVALRTDGGWTPVVGFDRKIQCAGGHSEELNLDNPQDAHSCGVRVLGFKKRLEGFNVEVRAGLPGTVPLADAAP